jgi:hypothetical protein
MNKPELRFPQIVLVPAMHLDRWQCRQQRPAACSSA